MLTYIITHASIAAGVGVAFSHVCLSLCPRSKRKTAWAIDTKLCTLILYSSRSACIDLKRSKVKVTQFQKPSRLLVTCAAAAGVVLHVDLTDYVL